MSEKEWNVNSWQQFQCLQMPFYPYLSEEVESVHMQLSQLPALVTVKQIQQLQQQLLQLVAKKSFLLHCGTCAETFGDANPTYVSCQIKMLNILASRIDTLLSKPVIKIARLAGQFGKPRTKILQHVANTEILNYFGDIVNQMNPLVDDRLPAAGNMLQAYYYSDKMIKFIDDYELDDCFFSHETFLLPYEAAFTRQNIGNSNWYNVATHFPWIGKRSLYPNSPHIEYIRGIHNPIGIKLSEDIPIQFLIEVIERLNPNNEVARIVLIPRFGIDKIEKYLPVYLQAIQNKELAVIWLVDPMHGNTEFLSDGRKFRSTKSILAEALLAAQIHAAYGSYLAGIHLECVNEPVAECAEDCQEINLSILYTSAMDPRLNMQQAIEITEQFTQALL